MVTITINFTDVQVDAFTYARIQKVAQEKRIDLDAAISFLLQKVI